MKLNNKGMTLVELLVTFSLLLVIVVGMFNLIMDVKFELDDKQVAKDFTEYSATISNDIHYNLLYNKPFVILIKSSASNNWTCYEKNTEIGTCEEKVSGGGFVFKHKEVSSNGGKQYEELDESCQNIYPCSVYVYKSGTNIAYNTIALNKAGTNTADTTEEETILNKHGIYYKGVFESIPNQEYISLIPESLPSSEEKIEMKMTERGVFVIDFSYYLLKHDKNYGFKIAYPFSETT